MSQLTKRQRQTLIKTILSGLRWMQEDQEHHILLGILSKEKNDDTGETLALSMLTTVSGDGVMLMLRNMQDHWEDSDSLIRSFDP